MEERLALPPPLRAVEKKKSPERDLLYLVARRNRAALAGLIFPILRKESPDESRAREALMRRR
jgi:hypothetical protein